MKFWKVCLFSLSICSALSERASALSFELNGFYFNDQLTSTTSTTNTRTLWDFAALLDLTKKGDLVLGWAYGAISTSDGSTSTTTFSATEMGPRLGYYLDRNMSWSVFVTYALIAKANYSTGGSTAEWRGSSLKADIGYVPLVTENVAAGIRLNYHKPSYNEQITGSTTLTKTSNSRSVIYPSMAFSYRF